MSTTVRAPKTKDWPLAPMGLHQLVCLDVYPITTEKVDASKYDKTKSGEKLRDVTRLVWGLVGDDGKPLKDDKGEAVLVSKKYGASLHEKATLTKDLEAWRGKKLTDEDKAGFELEAVVGANGQGQVTHNLFKEKMYANLTAIVPLSKGQKKVSSEEWTGLYTRAKDRKKETAPDGGPKDEWVADDSDIPF